MGEYFVENLFYIIIGLSVLSFIILKIGAKFIGLVARGIFGVASIFVLNILLSPFNIPTAILNGESNIFNIAVGINALTGLLATFLGFPAVVLMFGLALLFR